MKITKNELIEIIKQEAQAVMTTGAGATEGANPLDDMYNEDPSKITAMKYQPLMNLYMTHCGGHEEGSPEGTFRSNGCQLAGETLEAKKQGHHSFGKLDPRRLEETKNCGCGQDPCKTYGALEENKVKMTKSKLQQIILEETKLALEGDVPGRISGGDLVAAITLAIDEVFQESRPDHEAAAIAYAQISHSLDEIFKQSYKAAARAGKMMGGNPDEPGDLGGLGL